MGEIEWLKKALLMIVSCPECQAKYNIPDDKITPAGRKVKCKKCDHVWLCMIEALKDEMNEVKPIAQKRFKKLAQIMTLLGVFFIPRKKGFFFWSNSLMMLSAILIWSVLNFMPSMVVSLFPQTLNYYVAMGKMDAPLKAKTIEIEEAKTSYDPTHDSYKIEAFLKNLTQEIQKLPAKIELIGFDEGNLPVQNWQFELANNFIEPGTKLKLTYELISVKKEVAHIELKLEQV